MRALAFQKRCAAYTLPNEYYRSFRVSKDLLLLSFCALICAKERAQARVKWRVASFCYLFCSLLFEDFLGFLRFCWLDTFVLTALTRLFETNKGDGDVFVDHIFEERWSCWGCVFVMMNDFVRFYLRFWGDVLLVSLLSSKVFVLYIF